MKKKLYATTSGILLGGIFLFGLSGCSTMSQLTSWLPFSGGGSGYFQQRHSGQVESYYRAACLYQERNQHRRAIDEFQKVLREEPGYAKAYNGMGVSYDQLREFRKAVGCYRAALNIDRNLDYVYNNLGYSLLMQGQVEGAITSFRNAIALNDGIDCYHNNLGLAYSQKGEIELAQTEFKRGHGNLPTIAEPPQRVVSVNIEEPPVQNISNPAAVDASPSQELLSVAENVATEIELTPHPEEGNDMANTISVTTEMQREVPAVVVEEPLLARPPVVEDKSVVVQVKKVAMVAVQPENVPVTSTVTAPEESDVPLTVVDNVNRVSPPPTKPEPAARTLKIEVANGNGGYRTAKRWGNYLLKKGQDVSRISNADHFHYKKTIVYYREGYLQEAYQIAKQLPLYQDMKMVNNLGSEQIQIRVVIGEDMVRFGGKSLEDVLIARAKI